MRNLTDSTKMARELREEILRDVSTLEKLTDDFEKVWSDFAEIFQQAKEEERNDTR